MHGEQCAFQKLMNTILSLKLLFEKIVFSKSFIEKFGNAIPIYLSNADSSLFIGSFLFSYFDCEHAKWA
jgi:hypothetical protein